MRDGSCARKNRSVAVVLQVVVHVVKTGHIQVNAFCNRGAVAGLISEQLLCREGGITLNLEVNGGREVFDENVERNILIEPGGRAHRARDCGPERLVV